jgi:hypothetical protein
MKWSLACVCLLLSGCLVPAHGDPAPPTLEAVATPNVMGDFIAVKADIRVPEDYVYVSMGGGGDLVVTVVNATGHPITRLYEYGRGFRAGLSVVSELTLPAGTYTETFHWNGRRDVDQRLEAGPHAGERVAPGAYTIVIQHPHIDVLRTELQVAVMPVPDQP